MGGVNPASAATGDSDSPTSHVAYTWTDFRDGPNPATNLYRGFAIGTFQASADPPACAARTDASMDSAQIFSLLMSPDNCEGFIGDLEERHGEILQTKGRRAATIWFWREVALSFISLALDALKRLSGFEKLVERFRRIGS